MKIIKNSLFLFLLLVFAGCAFNAHLKRTEKHKLLENHLRLWQEFTADGILEANFQNYAFRKNIHIKKDTNSWKLTVYNAGIFGMKPQPFLTIKIDSLIVIHSQMEPGQSYYTENSGGLDLLKDPMKLLEYSGEIISSHQIVLHDKIKISFSNLMQIVQIEQIVTKHRLEFEYQNQLSGINIYEKNKQIAKIQIDKISYESER